VGEQPSTEKDARRTRDERLMNGSALRAKRRTLYLTSEELAGFLQVDEETVALWEADQDVIPLGIQHGILMLEFKLQADYENNSDEYRQLVDQRKRDWDREGLLRRRAAKKRRIE
jgi:DNA-binding XRE family transcriptional regulator